MINAIEEGEIIPTPGKVRLPPASDVNNEEQCAMGFLIGGEFSFWGVVFVEMLAFGLLLVAASGQKE